MTTPTPRTAPYGPNSAAVEALIDRAGRLTLDECEQLDAARYAARYVVWESEGEAGKRP